MTRRTEDRFQELEERIDILQQDLMRFARVGLRTGLMVNALMENIPRESYQGVAVSLRRGMRDHRSNLSPEDIEHLSLWLTTLDGLVGAYRSNAGKPILEIVQPNTSCGEDPAPGELFRRMCMSNEFRKPQAVGVFPKKAFAGAVRLISPRR